MNFKGFHRTAKVMGIIAVAATLSGCGEVINEGNFGIERYWGGQYNQKPLTTGWNFNMFDDIYQVHGRETQLNVADVRPKDSRNVMLRDLDITLTYKVNPEKAIPFLLKTADITRDNEKDVYVLGEKVLTKDAQSYVSETIRKFTSEEILDNKSLVENTFATDFQEEVNRLYGKGTFEIVDVKFANVLVAESVEEKIQAVAMVNAEKEKNQAIQAILASREETLTRKAQTIKNAADKAGITVDELLNYEMIEVLRESNNPISLNISTRNSPK